MEIHSFFINTQEEKKTKIFPIKYKILFDKAEHNLCKYFKQRNSL